MLDGLQSIQHKRAPKILVAAFVVIAVGIILVPVLWGGNSANKHHMLLADEGFEPERLKIQKGDTIIFSTDRDEHFWPASNDHPSHLIFSEFDPRRPIAPDDTWSFTFNRAGVWGLHDHLHSFHGAEIEVVE